MKLSTLFLTTGLFIASLAHAEAPKRYYKTADYKVGYDCTSAFASIKQTALSSCQEENADCKITDWGTLTSQPITNPVDLSQGWKYECSVFATAETIVADSDNQYEASLGLGGLYCETGASHFNALFARLGLTGDVHAYSRCNGKGAILFGVTTTSKHETIKASSPILFKKMEDCLKELKGQFIYNYQTETSISAANPEMSATLFCEAAPKKGFQLSGIISLF